MSWVRSRCLRRDDQLTEDLPVNCFSEALGKELWQEELRVETMSSDVNNLLDPSCGPA